MHPFFRSARHLLLAMLIWSPFCVGMGMLTHTLTGLQQGRAFLLAVPPMLFMLILALSTWVICRYVPVKHGAFARLVLTHLIAAFFIILVWLLLLRLYVLLLSGAAGGATDWRLYEGKVRLLFIAINAIVYIMAIFFHYMLIAMERNRQAEQQLLETDLARSRFELQALKATIHPHFLFNSLTALSVLIVTDPSRGREVCLQLADFLRFTLKMTQKRFIPLGEEIQHLRNYLGIEQVRLGARLKVEWRLAPDMFNCQVPPMLLQPLAENAIKHGIQPRLEGGSLEVETQHFSGSIQIVLSNPLADESPPQSAGEGLGLQTIRKRLLDEYGSKAEVKTEKGNGIFKVLLRMPDGMQKKRSKA